MTRIERYLLNNLFMATLYATAGLTLTIWLTQSLRLIELVVETGAPLRVFLWLLLLTVPTFLGVVLPIALVGGILFTYNKLAMDSELVVMRSVGLGPLALARPALWLAFAAVLTGYSLTLYITPAAHRELVSMEHSARDDFSQLLLREGVFNDVGERLNVYVRERDAEGNLHGVLIHDARVPEKPVTIVGDHAMMMKGEEGLRFVIFNGNRQELDHSTGKLSQLLFERYGLDLQASAESAGDRFPDTRERSTGELLEPPPEVLRDPDQVRQFVAELHQRLSSPLMALGYALIGLAALLSGDFNRRGQSTRITAAILLVVLLQSAALGLSSASRKMPVLIPLMYLLPLAASAAAVWYMLDDSRGRRVPRPILTGE